MAARLPATPGGPFPGEPELPRLARLIQAYAPHDGVFPLRIAGVNVTRRSRTNTDLVHAVQQSALCIVAQGEKNVMVGREVYRYEPARMIVYSVDVPVAAQVTRASPSEPYLSIRMDLDPRKVAGAVLKVFPQGLPPVRESGAVLVGQADAGILQALVRLIELTAHAGDAELLAPLVLEEILIRVLRGPLGTRAAQIGVEHSGVFGVARAVSWLRAHFSDPMTVDELARMANMSTSTFHQHFKSVTSMSPLQYQKTLRLQEARRLMLAPTMDAGTASRQVGYVSTSQFSREYGRFFGNPPVRDVALLREGVGAALDE